MQTVEVNIFSIVGNNLCTWPEDGEKIFLKIKQAIDFGYKVRLCFKNVSLLTASFLNVAIGKLYGEYDYDKIKERMEVCCASLDDRLLIRRVTDCAKQFYLKKRTEIQTEELNKNNPAYNTNLGYSSFLFDRKPELKHPFDNLIIQ